MISRLQDYLDKLQLDTSRASLGVWIALINVAVVILVVVGISVSGIGSLRDLADQQVRREWSSAVRWLVKTCAASARIR
jgi:hypothetical protein